MLLNKHTAVTVLCMSPHSAIQKAWTQKHDLDFCTQGPVLYKTNITKGECNHQWSLTEVWEIVTKLQLRLNPKTDRPCNSYMLPFEAYKKEQDARDQIFMYLLIFFNFTFFFSSCLTVFNLPSVTKRKLFVFVLFISVWKVGIFK